MSSLKDRIQTEYSVILDNFANLVKSFTIADDQIDSGRIQVPGDLPEIFAQKLILSCQVLLDISHDLKRTAILNDFVARNKEVLDERRALRARSRALATSGHGAPRREDGEKADADAGAVDAERADAGAGAPGADEDDGGELDDEDLEAMVEI